MMFQPDSRLWRVLYVRSDKATTVRFFTVVAAPLFVLYLLTANWVMPYNVDALTNTLLAWEIATDGDVYLEDHAVLAQEKYRGVAAWLSPAGDSVTAQYPPGTALHLVPLYAVWPGSATVESFQRASPDESAPQLPVPPLFPAAVASAAIAAAVVGVLALVFRRLVSDRIALLGAYVAGLATGVWSVAADSLWQHGPAMLWIVIGVALAASLPAAAGLAFGVAILTRPHTALIAAATGLWQSWTRRTPRPAVAIGLGSSVGLVALILYNRLVFEKESVTGGYSDSLENRLFDTDFVDFFGNVVLSLVDPVRGLFVFSPFLILLLPGLRTAWRAAPAWVQGSAAGGLIYLLVQLKANRFSGGEGFWGYRYPLEALAAAAPLLLLSYSEWVVKQSEQYRRALAVLTGVSVAVTALGAVYFSSFWAGPTG